MNIKSKQLVLSFIIFLFSTNHNIASDLYSNNEEDPFYRIEWNSKADLPLPHRNGKAIACRGKIYFMGGYCPETEEVRETSNYEYDPQKDKWTIKANVPIGRSNFAITSFEDRIFVIGGDPVLPNNDLYLTDKDKWEVLNPLSIPRQHIDCGRIGDKIYVIGGCDKEFKAYNSVYEGIFTSLSPSALAQILPAETGRASRLLPTP